MSKSKLWSLVLCFLALGCGAPTASPDAGAPPADGATPTAHGGVVQVSTILLGGHASGGATFSGLFGDFDVASLELGDLPGCTRMQSGSCVAISCSGPSAALVGAGTITVDVGTEAPQTVAPGAASAYEAMTAAFTEGTVVAVHASGDVVPAFSLEVTAPAAPITSLPTTISASSPLTVTWSPSGAAADVLLALAPASAAAAPVAVTCSASGSDGTITVDPSLLATLGEGSVVVGLAGVASATTDAGAYSVALRATLGYGTIATITP